MIHENDMESLKASGLPEEIITERGYFSADTGASEITPKLAELGVKWAVRTREALVIPMYGPKGDLVSAQIRLRELPAANGKKPLRYLSALGMAQKLDVHPSNVNRIPDVSARLWITEGVKKGDALTAHGEVAISLAGVFTWRNNLGTLGDWEDVPLRNREVIVCFDSDTSEKRQILFAMKRLGKWLQSKGAKVRYLITPEVEGLDKTGVDDFLASGGTVNDLIAKATDQPPITRSADGTFSDSYLAESVAEEVMTDQFRWSEGTGWIKWDGRIWARCSEATVTEAVRLWAIDRFAKAVEESKGDNSRTRQEVIDGWRSVLGKARLGSIVFLTRGIVEFDASEMDADPDVLNCQNGVIDLRTGELMKHDPERLISKIAGANYDPTIKNDDLDAILSALPDDVRAWFQVRIGQAATGTMTPDDVMPVLHGGGSNGKTTLMDTVSSALGTYHSLIPDALLIGQASDFDRITLQGVRFALIEETPEAAHLDSVRLKKSVGSPEMRGAFKYKDQVQWRATHSLFLTTNYRPIVTETDTGTWRRLTLVTFPYTYVKGDPTAPYERKGDGTLRERASKDPEILSAMLRWIVEGACHFYAEGIPNVPESIEQETKAWRMESDMILAYWDERLQADPDGYVIATELYEDYCSWMESRGNRKPSEKLFTPRFRDHSETTRARIEKRRVRSTQEGLSRPIGRTEKPSAQVNAWVGLRFQDDDNPLAT